MADFSRFGAHLRLAHFSRFDPKSLTLAALGPAEVTPLITLTYCTPCNRAQGLTLTHISHISAPPSRTVNLGLQG